MLCIVLGIIAAVFVPTQALTDQGSGALPEILPSLAHWTITLLGLVVAGRLAWQAFGRAVTIAEVPTFPRYMTSRQQYRLGSFAFVLFSCGFFLLLVHENRDVIALAPLLPAIPESVLQAAKDQSAPYLVVIAAMGAVYLYLLTKEAQWNVLLMMRDAIQSWISVPQLAKQIIAQIRFALRIPQDALPKVIANSPEVVEQDFRKDSNTPDRMWAEICYMKWWLTQGHDAGDDATFFTEESFGFEKLMDEFQQASLTMSQWKSGAPAGLAASQITQSIRDLFSRFARLVACYLIYRNGSRADLRNEAGKFGIEVDAPIYDNPMRYWIVYIVVLIGSVYIGVIVSAVAYDVLQGKGLVLAQDPNRSLAWVMYSLCNYGLAIVVVLLLRFAVSSLTGDSIPSHLTTYCWTFLVAVVVGPCGLTVAVHYFGQGDLQQMPFVSLYYRMLRWGLGPALVTVYISYYLDRQSCSDLPDIDSSVGTVAWRLLNCFGFAATSLFLLLPPLLSLTAPAGATWETSKLRFIAAGTTFCVAFGLALAAQFALKKEPRATALERAKPSFS
ncbi:hypothetical protein [Bradyrhizobium erythrophlei]|uniref:Uncharacterized protein n=1 Tax=Bradyrhizobium erythrophlei TaxID=1437360 RepID=A0A1M5Y4R5_9BRAD|nr:hypothetical protein [Bradyrhizobium erythrophlei]SHI06992.1 hypothetical protein SAMN05443248_7916 [Bradyrhizobium erythrophlei]